MPTKLSKFCDSLVFAGCILSIILTPVFFNPYAEQAGRIFEGNKVFALRSIALIIILALLVKSIETKSDKSVIQKILKNPVAVLASALILIYSAATFLSPYFPISLNGFYLRDEGLYTILSYFTIFFAVLIYTENMEKVEVLVNALILTSIPICIYGILQFMGKDPVRPQSITPDRITGTFGGPIFFGAYIIMLIPITLSRIIKSRKSILSLLAYTAVFVLQITALYLTKSRGPLIGLIISISFLGFIIAAKHKIKWLFFSISGALALIFILLIVPQINNSPLSFLKPYLGRFSIESGSGANTTTVRLLVWDSAINTLKAKPSRLLTGYGPESMTFLYYKYYNPKLAQYEGEEVIPDHSHNDTLDSLITTGIMGLFIFLTVIVLSIYYVLKKIRLIRTNKDLTLFYLSILLSLIILSVTSIILGKGMVLIGIGIPAGIIMGLMVYLTIALYQKKTARDDVTSIDSDILLISLLCGVIAHFIEIQLGMALTATRLYFWVFIALISVLTRNFIAIDDKISDGHTKNPINNILLYSTFITLIASILSFSLINSKSMTSLIILLTSTIALSGLVVLPYILSQAKKTNLLFLIIQYILLIISWLGLFIGVYLSLIAEQVNLSVYIQFFYAWILLNLIIISILLPANKQETAKTISSPAKFIIYLFIFSVTCFVIYQVSLKIIYAELKYKVAVKMKQSEKAIPYYEESIRLSPGTDYYYEALSDLYFIKGDCKKSIEVTESIRKKNPYNPRHVRKLAILYRFLALKTFDKNERNKQFEKSLEYYFALIEKFAPTNPLYCRELGDTYKYKGDSSKAEENYNRALKLFPDSGPAYAALGDLYRGNINDNFKAINYYEKALNLNYPLSAVQALTLCEFYYNQKRFKDFIKVNHILINASKDTYLHRFYSAEAYQALGKISMSLAEAKIALTLAPKDKQGMIQNFINALENQSK